MQCYEGFQKWVNICVRIVKYCTDWDTKGNCVKCLLGYGDTNNNPIDGKCPLQTQNNSNSQNNTNTNNNVNTNTVGT